MVDVETVCDAFKQGRRHCCQEIGSHMDINSAEGEKVRDRWLIGQLVEREVEATTTWSRFAADSKVSRATLYRVKEGDEKITDRTFRRIERALGLPFDTLSSVGAHDFDVLLEIGVDRSLVEWLRRTEAASRRAPGARPT